MVFFKPEQRIGGQEIPHFIAPVIENQRAPIFMLPLPRVRVFIHERAIKIGQAVRVAREMRGHPVHNDADARFMAGVDKIHEIVRLPEAAGRRVKSGDLIAPRAIKRMLGNRQEFDMRKAHLLDVGNEFRG